MHAASALKRLLVGRKLASTQLGETLLPKRIALPVFASDALSSVAYAPDEILLTLSLAGMAGFAFSWKIALVVAVVMFVVILSYRQNVHAYPSGGGDYEVATVNIGPNAGLTVASALLVDYVLTVAVSVSSGVQNAEAMLPFIRGHEGWIAAAVIAVLMALNLRGVRESGTIFAIPTYCFMVGVIGMTLWGLARIFVLGQDLRSPTADWEVIGTSAYDNFTGFAMVALLARSFSSGCAALTGVEAISNGVPAFKPPKSRNAATTLALLGSIAVVMLLGIITLANLTKVHLVDDRGGSIYRLPDGSIRHEPGSTVMGQLARVVFYDDFRPAFYFMVAVTMLILFLAANTAFNGFPVLGSILARDGYLPRQLHTRGDRLAYSNGIVALALAAIGLVLIFNASVTALIQLYVVGVFVSFTVSQWGMLRHWTRRLATEADPGVRRQMQRSRVINGVGLAMTGTVLVIVLISKFTHGAYLAIIAMVVVFMAMKLISRHYSAVARELAYRDESDRVLPSRVRNVVFVNQFNKPTVRAVMFAKAAVGSSLEAVMVSIDPDETRTLLEQWQAADLDVPLKVIASPYREVTTPFIDHIRAMRTENPRDVVSVYIPEYVVGHWWEHMLHNQTALLIRTRLHFMQGVMVTSVPYQLRSSADAVPVPHDPQPWRRVGVTDRSSAG
ncbi:APC family permease [Aestuariimicrobium ganziense]|uniref:APC family permease n=1 Tax=Aestuariimicrobium ganziense TaxID=2773677 RepID=UPI001941EACE|nr:APC family permease [Aestuariimicrobium ganziense]